MSKGRDDQIVQAFELAVPEVVRDFQSASNRFWHEHDIHWSLFYYLRKQNAVREVYPTQLIRAEFPTLNEWDDRGHYDMVVLAPESVTGERIRELSADAPWEECLGLMDIVLAVEVKLWRDQVTPARAKELVERDIEKLTKQPNKVKRAYFLNFVQIEPSRLEAGYYDRLQGWLTEAKGNHRSLKTLCVACTVKQAGHELVWS